MKSTQARRLDSNGEMQSLSGPRNRDAFKRPMRVIVLVSLISVLLVCAYLYPRHSKASCYAFSSEGCDSFSGWLPPPLRQLTDEEIASRVVIRDILKSPPIKTKSSKIAFLFLTPGPLPFEKLWDKFFQGHEGKFSIYLHASKERTVHSSGYFFNTEIRSDEVNWGRISMLDAERRLLAHALKDLDNLHFVLLSESCIPLRSFRYVYNYLMYTNVSFIDCFKDLGPHGSGRHMEHMLPEIPKKDFRKGSQWFTMKRQHAVIIMADSLYYSKFRAYCRPGVEGNKNCIADEHYLPSFFHMLDPGGISNRSITYVDWTERRWHPKTFRRRAITRDFWKNITSADVDVHITSVGKGEELHVPCEWNGIRRPCYLFGRKFHPDALPVLLELFENYTSSAG